MRPNQRGSSTIGGKKSSVCTSARSASRRQHARVLEAGVAGQQVGVRNRVQLAENLPEAPGGQLGRSTGARRRSGSAGGLGHGSAMEGFAIRPGAARTGRVAATWRRGPRASSVRASSSTRPSGHAREHGDRLRGAQAVALAVAARQRHGPKLGSGFAGLAPEPANDWLATTSAPRSCSRSRSASAQSRSSSPAADSMRSVGIVAQRVAVAIEPQRRLERRQDQLVAAHRAIERVRARHARDQLPVADQDAGTAGRRAACRR